MSLEFAEGLAIGGFVLLFSVGFLSFKAQILRQANLECEQKILSAVKVLSRKIQEIDRRRK